MYGLKYVKMFKMYVKIYDLKYVKMFKMYVKCMLKYVLKCMV
jgi:hypothetical protein